MIDIICVSHGCSNLVLLGDDQQQIVGSKYSGAGLYPDEVEHNGNPNSSSVEVEQVSGIEA
nr:hypothetical protein [uncultured Allomuricauda sp.]